MPNLVAPLEADRAYIACPTCQRAGTPNVPLRRQMHLFVCPFTHQFTWPQLQQQQAEMTKLTEIAIEQPSPTSVAWKIFVAPQTKAALEVKFAGRLITTIGTMLDLLVDDSVIFIQGSEAQELRKRGLINPQQILAALDSYKTLEQERETAVKRLEQLLNTLRQSGIEG